MAEALAGKMFGESVWVSSAGLAAFPGQSANAYTLEILRERGIDFSGHSSRMFRAELGEEADWIIPMTMDQVEILKNSFPEYEHKIRRLGDWGGRNGDVADPWGGSREIYRRTAQEIEELLARLNEKLFPGQ